MKYVNSRYEEQRLLIALALTQDWLREKDLRLLRALGIAA